MASSQFHYEPRIYFENTGQIQQVEATWKLAIEIDVLAIDARFLQLEDYCEQIQKLCEKIHENIQPTCQNVIIEKDSAKLRLLIERLNTLYQIPKLKRGLIKGHRIHKQNTIRNYGCRGRNINKWINKIITE